MINVELRGQSVQASTDPVAAPSGVAIHRSAFRYCSAKTRLSPSIPVPSASLLMHVHTDLPSVALYAVASLGENPRAQSEFFLKYCVTLPPIFLSSPAHLSQLPAAALS